MLYNILVMNIVKQPMKSIGLVLLTQLLLVACSSNTVKEADPEIYSHKKMGAIKGADVVAYYRLNPGDKHVKGLSTISYHYKGADWYFSSEENRELFIADPEKYAPQYGGYCAYAVSHNFTKSIDPNRWHVIDGKLYLNYNRIADWLWRRDRSKVIEQADANWPTVLNQCEAHNNCADEEALN